MKKIAYLILAHSDSTHLKRLIENIDYKCDIYIHVDKKANIEDFKNKIKDKSNIYFSDNRFDIQWGGFNMINATKEMIKKALIKDNDYCHLVLLSGMDYPIKNKEEIYKFFNSNKDVEFIRGFDINESGSKIDKNRICKYWFWDINLYNLKFINKVLKKVMHYLAWPFNKSNLIKGELSPCFGSQWWAITPTCAKYVIDYSDKNKEIDRYFKYSYAPDELYFHTIIFNSEFKERTMNKDIEINKGHWDWANIHHIDPSLAKYFTDVDFNELKNSNKLFVRKVNTENSLELLNMMDEMINA